MDRNRNKNYDSSFRVGVGAIVWFKLGLWTLEGLSIMHLISHTLFREILLRRVHKYSLLLV